MKKLSIAILMLLFLLPVSVFAQDEGNNEWGISFSGFVKNDAFFDSRQTVNAREGHFLLWPAAEDLDLNDKDVNAKSSFNMLAVQSRLSGTIKGPDAFGAKTSGTIEGDFFAQANDNINLFRLRHAFLKLDWGSTQLLFGQYWNPMFVTSCFPGTVSFNTGSPVQPFARNPQIRLTQSFGDFKVIAAALAQRDYASRAPVPSSEYLRNSGMPDMHLQMHYSQSMLTAGAGIAYKKIVPRLETDPVGSDEGYKTDEGVSGLSAIAFAKLSLDPVTIKFEAVSGQNTADVLQISGFAVDEIDPLTDERSYTPIRNLSLWTDIHTNGDKFQVGLFAGYSKNRGTSEEIADPLPGQNAPKTSDYIMGFGTNIKFLYRISPRVIFNSGKTRFALETEYTSATFGADWDDNAVPTDTHTKGNLRILFSSYYFF
jgi:hypothetical protein